ncbi:mannose-6-phosphate isomerase, class I [uncultured Bifidobacterium sp.]|uniref:mannose-6-phosphate isomerase, class I n=1 Tax=uncultured Bifidobacterium sp. TaxID=165187 RepID=UPI0026019706|nr:mannose-6-phosphate isomerase, class I [uncultured Bifidobacterium sp.]
MFPIRAVEKHYAWGSYDRLQNMFHLGPVDGDHLEPLAEMWFSGHAESPSPLTLSDGVEVPLTDAIRRDPMTMLGEHDSQLFGPILPYLFKVISARIPLSLQVHPLDFEARAGFNRENAAGIPKEAPERSFKDTLAKNEMVVALEPFTASVGFAPVPFQLTLLRAVDHPLAGLMAEALTARTFHMGVPPAQFAQADAMMPVSSLIWPDSRRRVFRAFHAAVTAPKVSPDTLGPALEAASLKVRGRKARAAMDNALQAIHAFPGDPSVLCLLMLNPVCLEEGESVFIPAGTPHAYIHGTAAEIMTNSDNVLRAGMTPKHRDIPNLLRSLDCQPNATIDPSSSMIATLIMHNMVTYRPKINEYMLVYGNVSKGGAAWPLLTRLNQRYGDLIDKLGPRRLMIPRRGPRILLCTEGAVQCSTEYQSLTLRQGQAVFIPSEDGRVEITMAQRSGMNPEPAQENGSFLLASTPV